MYCTTKSRRRLREELVALLEEEIDRLLGSMEQAEVPPTLEHLENDILAAVFRLGQALLQQCVDLIGPGRSAEDPQCECGGPTEFQRYQVKMVLTLLGLIHVRRAYYTCGQCHHGIAPLDRQLRLDKTGLSGGLQNALCRTLARMPFAEAVQFLKSFHYPEVPETTVRRLAKQVGGELCQAQRQVVEESWAKTEPPPMEVEEAPLRLYVSMDGTKIHLQRGWAEIRLGAVYETEEVPKADGGVAIRTIKPSYLPYLGDVDTFGRLVYIEAARRGLEQAAEVIILGDGAEWIWRQARKICPEAVFIVDWWHATEHLWEAARALFGEGSDEAESWEELRETELWEGQVEQVIAALRQAQPPDEEAQETIQEQITYFTNQKDRMRYDEYRACGYQIGSGTVESACGRVIGQRLKQAGMIWSEEQAMAVSQIRAALLDGRWPAFWKARQPPLRRHRRKAA
ncbi:MAG: ISKra4 family transposase [Anaerolineae bacterium]